MTKHNYAVKMENQEHFAKAVGRSLPISTKHSIELTRFLRNKDLQKAKDMVSQIIAKKLPVPFKRFTEVAHKKGPVASGKFPEKAAVEVLKILNSVEANAQFKGLNTANLVIDHICAHKAAKQLHYGRRRGEMKRTHIEVVVKEVAKEEKKDKKAKAEKKVETKENKTEKAEEKKPAKAEKVEEKKEEK